MNETFLPWLAHAPEAVLMAVMLLRVLPRFQRENAATREAFQRENKEARDAFQKEMALERETHRGETTQFLASIRELTGVSHAQQLELTRQTHELRELRRDLRGVSEDLPSRSEG